MRAGSPGCLFEASPLNFAQLKHDRLEQTGRQQPMDEFALAHRA